jgi:hypothetical protein
VDTPFVPEEKESKKGNNLLESLAEIVCRSLANFFSLLPFSLQLCRTFSFVW